MDIEAFREHCLTLPGVTEDFPFGEDALAFRVGLKIFALVMLSRHPAQANLKCEPERAMELRERYPQHVLPGYHMNKRHWNTVLLEGPLTARQIGELVEHAHALVLASLSKGERARIAQAP